MATKKKPSRSRKTAKGRKPRRKRTPRPEAVLRHGLKMQAKADAILCPPGSPPRPDAVPPRSDAVGGAATARFSLAGSGSHPPFLEP